MRSIQDIKRSILLVVMLFLGTGASSPITPSNIDPEIRELINDTDCNKALFEQEIPEDGSWLTICWNDVTAPEKATVSKNHIQYIVDHPDVSQLEVQLIHGDVSYILWDREVQQGRKFGEELGSDAFRGAPSQGSWYLLVRDIVPSGDKGKLLEFTIVPFYTPVDVGLETMTESSGEGEPTVFSIPPDAVEVKPLDTDPVKSSPKMTIKGGDF